MTEQERLELVTTVEEEFDEPLERLEQSLEDVDDQIRETGHQTDEVEIEVSTTGVAKTMAELEAVERKLDDIDDKMGTIDVDDDFSPGSRGDQTVNVTAPTDIGVPDGSGASGDGDGGNVDFPSFRPDTPGASGAIAEGMDADDVEVDLRLSVAREPREFTDTDDDRSIRELAHEIGELRFTMGTFHNVVAAVLPLMGVFVGALPAAIAGVGALGVAALSAAAALGGIAALGGMGIAMSGGDSLGDELQQIQDAFVEAFSPLAQQFAPLMREAFTEIEAMMGPLATASAGLTQFRDEFRGLVSFITTGLPNAVGALLTFTDAAMPVLKGISTFIVEQDFLGFLAKQLANALPALVRIGAAFANILPTIVRISQGFLVVAAKILQFVSALTSAIDAVPFLAETLGFLAGMFLVALTVTTLYSVAVSGVIAKTAVLAGVLLQRVVVALGSYITSAVSAAYATYGLAAAVLTVISIVTLGLGAVAGLAGAFSSLGSNIGSARRELRKFASTPSGMRGPGPLGESGQMGGSGSIYHDDSTTIIYADDKDDAARQTYSSQFEKRQRIDSVFGG